MSMIFRDRVVSPSQGVSRMLLKAGSKHRVGKNGVDVVHSRRELRKSTFGGDGDVGGDPPSLGIGRGRPKI